MRMSSLSPEQYEVHRLFAKIIEFIQMALGNFSKFINIVYFKVEFIFILRTKVTEHETAQIVFLNLKVKNAMKRTLCITMKCLAFQCSSTKNV